MISPMKIDIRHLMNTLSIQTKSNNDTTIMQYIEKVVLSFGLKTKKDGYGNIYVTKGKSELYPCLVCHTDTVHSIVDDAKVMRDGDILFAFSEKKMKQVGIGGDDKSGVYITLQALKDLVNVKAVFFRNEEIGCLGSKNADKKFFDDCSYILEADRRGNSDFIKGSWYTELYSDEFKKQVTPVLKRHGYKEKTGLTTDVIALKENGVNLCMANISCGYYNPHTDKETVSIEDTNDAYVFIIDLIKTIGYDKKWEHTNPVLSVPKTNKSNINPNTNFYSNSNFHSNPTSMFIKTNELHKSGFYILDTIFPITLHKDKQCPKCKLKGSLVIEPIENEIYCMNCNEFLPVNSPIWKDVIIKDREKEFVYSSYREGWLPKEHSKWSKTSNSYLTNVEYWKDNV